MPTLLTSPIVDDISRRGLLTGLGATGLLTACGTGSVAQPAMAATREVVDGTGRTVVIPADPQRVLVLSALFDLSQLVDLGITPFAAFDTRNPTDRMPAALRGVVEGAQLLGNDAYEVDAEEIAALAPDLILHNIDYGGIDPAVVQRIAPTLSYESLNGGYDANLRRMAGWLGSDAEAPVRQWNDRLAELAAELNLDDRTFSIAFPITDAGIFQLNGPDSDIGRVVTALGGSVVPEQVGGAPLTEFAGDLSFEVLPDLVAADTVVLIRRYTRGSDEAIAEFTANPLWQTIDAVTRGDVIEIDIQDSTGSHGYGGLERAAQTIADGLTPNR